MGENKEVLEKYLKAGKVLAEVGREALQKIIRPGAKILDVAEFIEKKILEKGCGLAFPANISIDEHAAHYTPTASDTREIKEGELMKIDIGAHFEGFVADSAFTYCSEKDILVEGVERIIDKAISVLKPGLAVYEIAEAIEPVLKEFQIGLIVNLTGHGVDQNMFHAPPTIPSVKNRIDYQLQEGDCIALEPFTVKTNGYVKESGTVEIYRYFQDRPVRSTDARQILDSIKKNFGPFPFAKRWLVRPVKEGLTGFPPGKVSMALKQLEMAGCLETYPVLKEVEGKKVAQAEHTIYIKEKPVVTTRIDN